MSYEQHVHGDYDPKLAEYNARAILIEDLGTTRALSFAARHGGLATTQIRCGDGSSIEIDHRNEPATADVLQLITPHHVEGKKRRKR